MSNFAPPIVQLAVSDMLSALEFAPRPDAVDRERGPALNPDRCESVVGASNAPVEVEEHISCRPLTRIRASSCVIVQKIVFEIAVRRAVEGDGADALWKGHACHAGEIRASATVVSRSHLRGTIFGSFCRDSFREMLRKCFTGVTKLLAGMHIGQKEAPATHLGDAWPRAQEPEDGGGGA